MKKKLFILLTVVLLLLPIVASAESLWSYDRSTDTAYLSGEAYTPFELGTSYGVLPADYNVYKTESENELFYVHQPDDTYDVVFVSDYSSYHDGLKVYANTQGKNTLERFFAGNYSSYKLFEGNAYNTAGFNSAYVKTLDTTVATKELTVSSLQYLNRYDVAGLDGTGTLYRIHGAFYEYKSNYYYINYDVLDNTYFDADGNFSYRNGTVKLIEVPEDIESQVRSAASGIRYKTDSYNQTYDAYNTASDKLGATVVFVICTALLGYVLPLVPFILSIVFAHSKKALYPKRWYLLTACSAVWMIVFTCLVVLVLIC